MKHSSPNVTQWPLRRWCCSWPTTRWWSSAGSVTVDAGVSSRLPERERVLLEALAERPGAVVSKRALLRRVWGPGETDEHVVEVTIARLRQRLGVAGVGIETVIRRGYGCDPR